MAKDLLSVREVADRRGVTIWRIHQLIKNGTLKSEKYGNYYLIKVEDADSITIYGKQGRPSKKSGEQVAATKS